MRYFYRIGLAALALAGCTRDSSKGIASVGQALPGLPLPPSARVLSRAGSPEALQITFQSTWAADSLTNYYRHVLTRSPWTLQSDVVDQEGARVLYATREGPPIWLRITTTVGAPGSTLQMNGAVPRPKDSSGG